MLLDIFCSDIVRFIFDWNPASNEQAQPPVLICNVGYVVYAVIVMLLGFRGVCLDNNAIEFISLVLGRK